MKIALIIIVGLLAATVAGILLFGAATPATRSATVAAELPAPPERVWALITDVAGQTNWRPEVAAVAGDASAWTETTRRGDRIAFAVVASEPGRRWELRFTGAGFSGTWIGILAAAPGGTALTVTESVTVEGLFARALSRLFFSPDEHARRWLSDLGRGLAAR